MKTFLFSPRVACLLAVLTLTVIPFGGPRAAFFPNPSPITGVPLATGGAAIEANVLPGNYVLEASVDMANWVVLDTFCTTDGRVSYVDHDVNVRRFYRLGCLDDHNTLTHPLEYRGNTAVFTGGGFTPGAMIEIDSDNDGNVDLVVMADDLGFATAVIDTAALPDAQTASYTVKVNGIVQPGSPATFDLDRVGPSNPAATVPVCLSPDPEPFICLCSGPCPDDVFLRFTNSFTPSSNGVELATGKLRLPIPITGSQARGIDFHFDLNYASLVDYDGPWGQGMSHSMNLMIVRTGPLSGRIITPDLRIFEMTSLNGTDWDLPDGFFSRLTFDQAKARWKLVHFDGTTIEFYEGALAEPGYPVKAYDPNGNTMSFAYNGSGLLTEVKTALGQPQTFAYDASGRLQSFRNHLGHTWNFTINPATRQLVTIRTPATEHVTGPAGQLITDDTLAGALVTAPRTTTLSWHPLAASNLAAVTDGRGATPLQFTFDGAGRADQVTLNGNTATIDYNPILGPVPLPILDAGNKVVRVTDREDNISDHEIHGLAGGPVGGTGIAGLRRLVRWTETGKGNAPLRPGEPDYYESRVLQDCDCLKPAVITDPFASTALGLAFDANQIPTNFTRTIYTHNAIRQPLKIEVTDGSKTIQIAHSYQANAFGDGDEYSLLESTTDPRAFDPNPIYAGRSFLYEYEYDDRGNVVRFRAPETTLGQPAPQSVLEEWTYNKFGQEVSHTDANGNVTLTEYFAGSSVGGDVNSAGSFGGYPSAVTLGAPGSADAAPAIHIAYRVNALGMATEIIDGRGFTHTRNFNDLGESVRTARPPVDLGGGTFVQYETLDYYDAAGNAVLTRRSNIDADGAVPPDPWIDRSFSFDDIGNLLATRVETDANAANDLVAEMAYDRNDQLAVVQKPLGNRKFHIYDERNLPFKTFYGIAAGPSVTDAYPTDKRATVLGATTFVGLSSFNYDQRGNQNQIVDGRGNVFDAHHDFINRLSAISDQNGNGTVTRYDDASNPLTILAGGVDKATGLPLTIEAVTYLRYDELGRHYQTVQDIDLASDESGNLDPDDGANSSFTRQYDPGGRVLSATDGNGNVTVGLFDAADRLIRRVDALGNIADFEFDDNSNLLRVIELDTAGPGATGPDERYVTTFLWDELDRLRESHRLGLDGTSIDHVFLRRYDSRDNMRVFVDAEGTATVHTFDALDRRQMRQVFDADPFAGAANELERSTARYDGNSNTIERTAIGDLSSPGATQQTTRSAFDDLDRIFREVHPDSDDPIDGSGDGGDGIFDRSEVLYDANSNVVRAIDQRGVLANRQYDPGNRLLDIQLNLPPGVPGETRRQFGYDRLNRTVVARNDYSEVVTDFDPLSRVVAETQSIRLDGQGFASGWQSPIRVENGYDKQSNLVSCQVLDGLAQDLAILCGRDPLNRTDSITADYFGTGMHPIAGYAFFGRVRMQSCQFGNGVVHEQAFDTKRRLAVSEWKDPANNLLAGFEYGYDRMNNALFEQVLHDGGRFDHFRYDRRYQLTGVEFRSANPVPGAVTDQFVFDSNYSRRSASYSSPMGGPATNDAYSKNLANEFTNIMRNGNPANVQHDRAGNTTELPIRPVMGPGPNTNDQPGTGVFDGFDQLHQFQATFLPAAATGFRVDALGRRIATIQGATPARRYIYGMSRVLEERTFDPGATLANAPSTLERIYVDGLGVDEHVLCAIDRNGDRQLGGGHPKNEPDPTADQEYYYLLDRLGSTAALVDADRPDRVLEYVRHNTSGEPSVMPVVDGNMDGYEDTPGDLSDNAGNIDRASLAYGNSYQHAGRRWDHNLGLYYNRARYYEPATGQFLERDPMGYAESFNLYTYGMQNPVNRVDPFGGSSLSVDWTSKVKDVNISDDRTGGRLVVKGATVTVKCMVCEVMLHKSDKRLKDPRICEILGPEDKKGNMLTRIKTKFRISKDMDVKIKAEIWVQSGTMPFDKGSLDRVPKGTAGALTLGAADYVNAEIKHAEQLASVMWGYNPAGAFNPAQLALARNFWKQLAAMLPRQDRCPYTSKKKCDKHARLLSEKLSKKATALIMGTKPTSNNGNGNGIWNELIDTFGTKDTKGYPDIPLEKASRDHMVKNHNPKRTKSSHRQKKGSAAPVKPPSRK